jgi:MFS family permease
MIWHQLLQREYRHVKGVIPLSLSLFIFYLGWALVSPIFAIRVNEITGSLEITGVIFAILSMISLIFDIPVGIASDRFDKKRILQFSLFGYVVVGFLYTVVQDIVSLVLLRVFHSFISLVFWIVSWAILREMTDDKHREEEMGFYSSMNSIADMIGPLIGSSLIVLFSWRMPFYLMAIMCFISALSLSRIKVNKRVDTKPGFRDEISHFLSFGKYAFGLVFGMITIYLVAFGFGAFLPIVLENVGFTISEIGVLLAFATTVPWIVLPIPLGMFCDKHGRKPGVVVGAILSAVGLLLFNPLTGFWFTAASTFIVTSGFCMIAVTLNTIVGDMAGEGEAGGFTGLTQMPKDFAGIIGPIATGMALPIIGVQATMLLFSGICLISAPVLAATTK